MLRLESEEGVWNIDNELAQKCEEAVANSGLAPKEDTAVEATATPAVVIESDDETAKLAKEALWLHFLPFHTCKKL